MKQTITIKDLAKLAGVSVATVSRALSGSNRVSDETRVRIEDLAKKYSFEPSAAARSLTLKSTGLIGVLIDDITNPFFVHVVKGVESCLEGTGRRMIVASSNWEAKKEVEVARDFVRNRVDGVIVAPTSERSEAIELFRRHSLPYVLVNIRGGASESFVCCDNELGGRLAAQHLIARGIERLVYLVGFPHQTAADRVKGVCQAVAALGRSDIELIEEKGIRNLNEGYETAPALVAKHKLDNGRAGVFALNDTVACGFLKALIELRIDVPETLALVGFDDISLSDILVRPLTTVSQPKEEMGRIATEMLLTRLKAPDAPPPPGRILKPRLIVRST